MSDEEQWPPPPAPKRPPREELWTLVRGAESRAAILLNRGEAIGCELQIFVNGEFVSGRRFPTRDLALAEVDGARDALEAAGFK